MSLDKMFFRVLALLAVLVVCGYSAESLAKVHSVIGEVDRATKKNPEWKQLHVGNKVAMHDRLRSALESEATFNMPDGSMITLTENSEITIAQMTQEEGAIQTSIDITSGRLVFSAQKQQNNSNFKFKTGTMVAAIRGTDGCIDGGEVLIAGLQTGALQVELNSGEKLMILGGQIVFKRDSLIVIDVASAGDPSFHKDLATVVRDTSFNHAELIQKILRLDSIYQNALDSAKKRIECVIDALPDTVSTEEITIHGYCPAGAKANFYGKEVVLEKDGRFLSSVSLDSVAVGEKLFRLTCVQGDLKFFCSEARTYYKPQEVKVQSQVVINSAIPAKVCEEGLVVEGSYQTSDTNATLVLSVGSAFRSMNLVKIPDGKSHPFQQIVSISDRNGLWNETMAILEFDADGKKTLKEIPIRVNRTCQSVNQIQPIVKIVDYDSLLCTANISVENFQDDLGTFKVNVDNVDGRTSIVHKDFTTNIKLTNGIHEYEFIAHDQAGNVASQTKTLGCFPDKFFKVRFTSGKDYETIWVPPSPPMVQGDVGRRVVKKTLRFSIDLDDVSEVYSVTVKQNGRNILHETLSQIEMLDYDLPVELIRGKTNKFEIFVKHKNGRVVKATQIYEVK